MRWLPLIWLVACQEEALRHPPPPPNLPVNLNWEPTTRKTATPEPSSTAASAPAGKTKVVTMAEFMRDFIEPEARVALRDKAPSPKLDALLKDLAEMNPDEAVFPKWSEQTLASMSPQTYAVGCKTCHAAYLKLYKRKHRADTYEVSVP